jgi:hypothetical protein
MRWKPPECEPVWNSGADTLLDERVDHSRHPLLRLMMIYGDCPRQSSNRLWSPPMGLVVVGMHQEVGMEENHMEHRNVYMYHLWIGPPSP